MLKLVLVDEKGNAHHVAEVYEAGDTTVTALDAGGVYNLGDACDCADLLDDVKAVVEQQRTWASRA